MGREEGGEEADVQTMNGGEQGEQTVSRDEAERDQPRPKNCYRCRGQIKKTAEFIRCRECNTCFHKQWKCSGIRRMRLAVMNQRQKKRWRCDTCAQGRTRIPTENPQNTAEDVGKKKCKMCKGIIKGGTDFLRCAACNGAMHK